VSQVSEMHVILRIFIWRHPHGIQIPPMANRQTAGLIIAQQITTPVIATVNNQKNRTKNRTTLNIN
jgi:hypothetical protein